MSMSWYLGPFAICKNPLTMHQRTIVTCPSDAERCSWHNMAHLGGVRFCAECGAEFASVVVEREGPAVDAFEVEEQINERLAAWRKDGKDCYTSNWSADSADLAVGSFNDTDTFCRSVSPSTQHTESAWFIEKFQKELDYLKSAYGAENVRVRWGLLSEYS